MINSISVNKKKTKNKKANVPLGKHANETVTYSKCFIQGALFKSAKRKKSNSFSFCILFVFLCRQRSLDRPEG